jgi:hypothetical protein
VEQPTEGTEERREIVAGLEIFRKTWNDGRPWIVIYNANRRPGRHFPKPVLNLSFRTWEQAEVRIASEIAARVKWEESKKARAAERMAYRHDFKVGDILYTSWGYDQTNIEFFQVVAIPTPKSITVREIASAMPRGEEGFMCGYVVAVKDSFIGEPITKLVSTSGSIRFESYRYAWKWDGRERYCSWYA